MVTVACKSKTTNKNHTKRTLPRRGERCVPSENATEEAHAKSHCRLWDFERPRLQIPIPRHMKVFVVMCCCVYKEPAGRGARARHAACWLLGALEEAGRTCAHAVRGARERRNSRFTAKDSDMASRPIDRKHQEHSRPGTEPNRPAIAPRGPRPRGCCPLPRRSPSLRARSAPSLHA